MNRHYISDGVLVKYEKEIGKLRYLVVLGQLM